MNLICIVGNVTKDLELNQTKTGKSVCQFDVAVSRRFDREITDFFRVVVWEKIAEICCQYLKKGSKVGITGEMQSRQYESEHGKRTIWEIRADNVEFLSSKSEPGKKEETQPSYEDDDLPF
jgi:single-strand DNA-binding protein